jgi:hypothetical protein
MMWLLVALFYHMALGLEVVIGDYVHVRPVKLAALLAMRLACFTLTIIGLFAVRAGFNAAMRPSGLFRQPVKVRINGFRLNLFRHQVERIG